MTTQTIKAHLAIIGTSLLFGGNYWVSKILTNQFAVESLVFYRTIGAALLFWLYSFFRPSEKVSTKDMFYIFLAAVAGITLNQVFFFMGMKLSNPVDVSLIHLTNPIFVLMISVLFLKQKISNSKVAGIVVGALGAAWLVLSNGNFTFGTGNMKGNVFVLINTFSYGIYLLMTKPLLSRYSVATLMKWVYLFGALTIIPYGIDQTIEVDYSQFNLTTVAALAYIVVAVTFGAYLLLAYSLQHLSPTVVSFYSYTQPLFVAFISIIVVRQMLNSNQLIASLVIFFGVFLVVRDAKKKLKIK